MKVHVQSFKINILNMLMKTEDKMRIQQKTETYFKSVKWRILEQKSTTTNQKIQWVSLTRLHKDEERINEQKNQEKIHTLKLSCVLHFATP